MATVDETHTYMDTTANCRASTPSKDVPVEGEELHVPKRPQTVNTTHLQLVRGENKRFGATRTLGCGFVYQLEDTIVVTDQRALFLWRRWGFGMSLVSLEESFYLNDLQFVSLVRVMHWIWLWLALIGIIIGAILLGAAKPYKPTVVTTEVNSSYNSAYDSGFRSRDSYSPPPVPKPSYIYTETGDQGMYSALVAPGVILLLAGIAFLVVFVVRHLYRGVFLSLNFCRKDTGIVEWLGGSWWRPKHSSTQRQIKLPRDKAQAAYNVLNGMLHEKFSMRGLTRPEAADGSHGWCGS